MKINILLYLVTLFLMYISLKKNLKYLYMFFFATTPFTATSLVNISGMSISLPLYIGLFLILSFLFKILKKRKLKRIKANKFLILFYLFCVISMISPLYLKGGFKITSNISNEYIDYFLLEKYPTIISHILYLTYCLIIYIITIYIIEKFKINLKDFFKIYKKSFYIVCVFCLFEIIFYKIGRMKEFNEIFKMNESILIQGYGNFLRVSGPNGEPSMFSIYLLTSIGIFYFFNQNKELILSIFLGVLTTSTSFIIGLLFYFIIDVFFLRDRKLFKILFGIVLICISIKILTWSYPVMEKLFIEIVDKIKGQGVSGNDRMFNILSHLKVSISINPFLGIGYGVARSKDLLTTWLVNIGYFGVIFFIVALGKSTLKNKYLGTILLTVFVVEFISVPEPYFLYLWCLWGVLDSNIKSYKFKEKL